MSEFSSSPPYKVVQRMSRNFEDPRNAQNQAVQEQLHALKEIASSLQSRLPGDSATFAPPPPEDPRFTPSPTKPFPGSHAMQTSFQAPPVTPSRFYNAEESFWTERRTKLAALSAASTITDMNVPSPAPPVLNSVVPPAQLQDDVDFSRYLNDDTLGLGQSHRSSPPQPNIPNTVPVPSRQLQPQTTQSFQPPNSRHSKYHFDMQQKQLELASTRSRLSEMMYRSESEKVRLSEAKKAEVDRYTQQLQERFQTQASILDTYAQRLYTRFKAIEKLEEQYLRFINGVDPPPSESTVAQLTEMYSNFIQQPLEQPPQVSLELPTAAPAAASCATTEPQQSHVHETSVIHHQANALIKELSEELEIAEAKIARFESLEQRLKRQHENEMRDAISDAVTDLKTQLAESHESARFLQPRLHELESKCQLLQQEGNAMRQQYEKKIEALQRELQESLHEVDRLNQLAVSALPPGSPTESARMRLASQYASKQLKEADFKALAERQYRDGYQQMLRTLKSAHTKELQRMSTMHQNAMEEQASQYENAMANVKDECAQAMEKLAAEAHSAEALASEENARHITSLQRQVGDLQEELERVKREYREETEKAIQDREYDLYTQRKEMEESTALFKEDIELRVVQQKRDHELEIQALQAEHDDHMNAVDIEHQRELQAVRSALMDGESAFTDLKHEFEKRITEIKEESARDKDEEVASKVASLEAHHDAKVAELQASLTLAEEEHKYALNHLRREMEREHRSAIDNLTKDHLQQLSSLQEQHEKSIRQANQELKKAYAIIELTQSMAQDDMSQSQAVEASLAALMSPAVSSRSHEKSSSHRRSHTSQGSVVESSSTTFDVTALSEDRHPTTVNRSTSSQGAFPKHTDTSGLSGPSAGRHTPVASREERSSSPVSARESEHSHNHHQHHSSSSSAASRPLRGSASTTLTCLRCGSNDRTSPEECSFHPFLAPSNPAVDEWMYTDAWHACQNDKHRPFTPGCVTLTSHLYEKIIGSPDARDTPQPRVSVPKPSGATSTSASSCSSPSQSPSSVDGSSRPGIDNASHAEPGVRSTGSPDHHSSSHHSGSHRHSSPIASEVPARWSGTSSSPANKDVGLTGHSSSHSDSRSHSHSGPESSGHGSYRARKDPASRCEKAQESYTALGNRNTVVLGPTNDRYAVTSTGQLQVTQEMSSRTPTTLYTRMLDEYLHKSNEE